MDNRYVKNSAVYGSRNWLPFWIEQALDLTAGEYFSIWKDEYLTDEGRSAILLLGGHRTAEGNWAAPSKAFATLLRAEQSRTYTDKEKS